MKLVHVSDAAPGIRRQRTRGGAFVYAGAKGKIKSAATLARIRKLVIPPAWTEVWICPDVRGHIQATGRDARGRKQYIYHPGFRATQEESKFHRLPAFAKALPRIRRALRRHMQARDLSRTKVLAAIVWLLEHTLIRVGNEQYARSNRSK